jgi:hypothetical protein
VTEPGGDPGVERRPRQTWRSALCWLLLATAAGALWLGRPARLAGSGVGRSSLATAADGFRARGSVSSRRVCGETWGRRSSPAAEESTVCSAEGRAGSETRDRCELAVYFAAPHGAIAVVECSYERHTRNERVRDDGATESDPPVRHRRWVWAAAALLPVLLVCVLLPEAEQ